MMLLQKQATIPIASFTKMDIDGLSHEVLSKLCRDKSSEMAHIIRSMQSDIAEMKRERIVNKYLVLFHDAKKVLRPWDNTFLDISYLNAIWMNDISNNIVQLSCLRNDTSHFIDTTKNGTPLQEYNMRMKFILEKLSDDVITTPNVRDDLKKLSGGGNDPVESMCQMLLHKYENIEIPQESREKYECEWKYL